MAIILVLNVDIIIMIIIILIIIIIFITIISPLLHQAFTFLEQSASDHYRSLRKELNPGREGEEAGPSSLQPPSLPSSLLPPSPASPLSASREAREQQGIRKQVSTNFWITLLKSGFNTVRLTPG